MKDLICKVCSSHHFNKITDTEYQCKHCGFTMLTQSEDIDKKKVSLIEAYDKLNIGDYVEAEERFSYILNNNPKDYEALWGKIVSHYGIVFVNSDGNIFPTFHDFSKECFLDNKLYKEFLEIVPDNKVDIYKTIANQIEDLRCKYYNITLTEKDYDIFISFKQSDENNNKTLDYYEALKLYTYLINKGYRVFFSPITLQNKIGSEYEPFIYHALRTSKVLIVYGQKEEYFESIWVKNEWARYQKMIETNQKEDGSLIVCIENMNAYDLPSRIRSLQVIDFTDNKEAYETLDRNIQRIISKDNKVNLNEIKILIDIQKNYEAAEENILKLLKDDFDNYDIWYYYLKAITKGFIDNSSDNINYIFDNLYRLGKDNNKKELDKIKESLFPKKVIDVKPIKPKNEETKKKDDDRLLKIFKDAIANEARQELEEKHKKEQQVKKQTINKTIISKEKQTEIINKTFNSTYKQVGKYIYFGQYPQSLKQDNIKILDSLNYNNNEYYVGSDDAIYVKVKSQPFDYENIFSNGKRIEKEKEYYFKVEPVKWELLSKDNNEALLLSKYMVDASNFDNHKNDYENSHIYKFLNGTMLKQMFTEEQLNAIKKTNLGKMFLLSCDDINSRSLGICEETRVKELTDYTNISFTIKNQDNPYWLRTVHNEEKSYICHKDSMTSFWKSESYGVVPAIKLILNENNKISFDYLKLSNNDLYLFGQYPQTIKDNNVNILNKIEGSNYYLGSDNEKYAKVIANAYQDNLCFSNGEIVKEGQEYYFKVEPVKWKILTIENRTALLFSDKILDSHNYDIYNCSYSSKIHSYINETMFNEMFTENQKKLILQTIGKQYKTKTIKKLFKSKYAIEEDIFNLNSLFLLSKEDISNSSYGFSKSNEIDNARVKKITDYAIVKKGTYNVFNSKERNGWYWLRTPYNNTEVCGVGTRGYAENHYNITLENGGIVPALWLVLMN